MFSATRQLIKRVPFARSAVALARRFATSHNPVEGLALNAIYDRQTGTVMRRVLKSDSIAVDIGANQGNVLAEMVAIAPHGKHLAFEPIPHLAEGLRQRFPMVDVHQCALSDQPGESTFIHVVNDPGYSGLRPRSYDRPDPQFEHLTVKTERLDNLIPLGTHVDFIKIDVEGGEYHALLGAAATIARCRPVIVFEGSIRSTGMYGVSGTQMYDLVTQTFGMELSTMGRWLSGQRPLTQREFRGHYKRGPEYYFIAYPTEGPQRSR
jgi:FkbM family methyltransferase